MYAFAPSSLCSQWCKPDHCQVCWQVACLTDNAAHLALEKDDPYVVQRKPHGHGDVHALLHSTGLVKKWQQNGIQWVCFFQDTNGLVFRALPAALGRAVLVHTEIPQGKSCHYKLDSGVQQQPCDSCSIPSSIGLCESVP